MYWWIRTLESCGLRARARRWSQSSRAVSNSAVSAVSERLFSDSVYRTSGQSVTHP